MTSITSSQVAVAFKTANDLPIHVSQESLDRARSQHVAYNAVYDPFDDDVEFAAFSQKTTFDDPSPKIVPNEDEISTQDRVKVQFTTANKQPILVPREALEQAKQRQAEINNALEENVDMEVEQEKKDDNDTFDLKDDVEDEDVEFSAFSQETPARTPIDVKTPVRRGTASSIFTPSSATASPSMPDNPIATPVYKIKSDSAVSTPFTPPTLTPQARAAMLARRQSRKRKNENDDVDEGGESAASPSLAAMTPDQRRRLEANRASALAKRRSVGNIAAKH